MTSTIPPEVRTRILSDAQRVSDILSDTLCRNGDKTKTREQFLSDSMELLQWCIMSRKLRSSETLSELRDVLSGYCFFNPTVQTIIEEMDDYVLNTSLSV